MAANCSTVVCKNCKEEGHQTKDCKQTKCCNLCGAAGHLYKTCPKRCLSYAQAARSKERPGEGSMMASAVRKETSNLLRSEELQPEKEGEAAETNGPAPTQRPETPTPQTESMEEEAADGQTGQWQVVQRKTTKKKHPKATTQTSGKRRLSSESDCNNSSSLDGEMLERQPLQKRRQNSEMDDKASQPPGTGSCDGPGMPQPQFPTRNDVANASQLRDTGSKDTSGAPELRETGSCDVFEEEQMEAAEDNPMLSAYKTPPMSPERHKPCMKNQEGFLSPTNVKLLAHTMGMQEHPEGEALGLARTNEHIKREQGTANCLPGVAEDVGGEQLAGDPKTVQRARTTDRTLGDDDILSESMDNVTIKEKKVQATGKAPRDLLTFEDTESLGETHDEKLAKQLNKQFYQEERDYGTVTTDSKMLTEHPVLVKYRKQAVGQGICFAPPPPHHSGRML
ncbi:uncharacterized protein [Heterodontus francisci]|uniref:uncharacterized protein n=1 Tax=Heterodontus francisci TaxID=7792 RepID=UPI00355C2294